MIVFKDEAGLESCHHCVATDCLEPLYAYLRLRMEYRPKINITPAHDPQDKCKGLPP
jgi:hypothetical protein